MALNRFMHPRNIYKNPPDFKELAEIYPEFQKASKKNLSGQIKLDFTDKNAVRILTKCLLHKDFNLQVDLPEDKLVPTLSLRLNYILWIEDILETFQLKENVIGVDIGCGASCIYCLLAARKNGWKMHGIEVDESSYNIALKNVNENSLQSLIHLIKQDNTDRLFKFVKDINEVIHFTMCNPPFFGSSDENIMQNRTGNRDPPKASKTGAHVELQVEGGEKQFVCKMIDESFEIKEKVLVYTSMLGKKSSLTELKQYLKEKGITNVISTEFCQGRTTRWGIAWTLAPGIYLNKVPHCEKRTGKKTIGHSVGFTFPHIASIDFENWENILNKLFEDIQASIILCEHEVNQTIWEASVLENTWSHQRRKRRQHQKQQEKGSSESSSPSTKKVKLGSPTDPYLTFSACLKQDSNEIHVYVGYLEGPAGKDAANQILQFIKNNYSKYIVR